MNAIEFVKKYGWKEAQICLLNCAMPQDRWFMRRGDLISGHDFDDLKQIVDAFELVEKSGGLKVCRKTLKIMDNINADKNGLIYKPFSEAVNLVEQCL